jgi:hypothetical protein
VVIAQRGSDLASILPKLSCIAHQGAASCEAVDPATVAFGITADGDAAALIAIETNETSAPLTLTVTNEATLVQYDPNFRSYPPKPGTATLVIQPSQFITINGSLYGVGILQAPDILQRGADGNLPNYTQPIVVTAQIGSSPPAQTQAALDPPPVLFVHGLWGNQDSLSAVQTYMAGQAPWNGVPAGFLNVFKYENDAAFDSASIETAVEDEISLISATLSNAQVAWGRLDIVAHSMGGLVVRHYSGASGYQGPQNRTLGAYHQIITINTPEVGSLLANFLIQNYTVEFNTSAGPIPKLVKHFACPAASSKTVQACFGEMKENLAPPGQPIESGAVYSLEPDGPSLQNLMSLPPDIPNTVWRALGSTITQNDNPLKPYPKQANALLFGLDNLIAATCPGQSYCSPSIQTVGDILNDDINDGIVTLASQTAQCTAPCQTFLVENVAHTSSQVKYDEQKWILNYGSVLTDFDVKSATACYLAGTCPNGPARRPIARAALPSDLKPDGARYASADESSLPREVRRLQTRLPQHITMGVPFQLAVRAPRSLVAVARVTELDDGGNGVDEFEVPIKSAADGQTYVEIPPLLMGEVTFDIRVFYKDDAYTVESLSAQVGPPTVAPAAFWVDSGLDDRNPGRRYPGPRLSGVPGRRGLLQPDILLACAPHQYIDLKHRATFRVLPSDGPPVVSIDADGTYLPLRVGTATIEVGFAGFTAREEMAVRPW